MRAEWLKYRLGFRFTAITSRERLSYKDTYYIKVWDESCPDVIGIGEAGLFRGLSSDDTPEYENILTDICKGINRYANNTESLSEYPSIRFGIESAIRDLMNGGNRYLFPSEWTSGKIPMTINGLIWMGDKATMRSRIDQKLKEGFSCIKVKIGGIDFNQELELLSYIRNQAPDIEIRLDANGAFRAEDALSRLDSLSRFRIHSIEQPIRQGQYDKMSHICSQSPIPIALDEELIGLNDNDSRIKMLETIRPHYIILKPTLTGGFTASDEWIDLAKERGIGWWATSALESNIGLNAIAQWIAIHKPEMPQGLGTGQLYDNNIPSPLTLNGEKLWYGPNNNWDMQHIMHL